MHGVRRLQPPLQPRVSIRVASALRRVRGTPQKVHPRRAPTTCRRMRRVPPCTSPRGSPPRRRELQRPPQQMATAPAAHAQRPAPALASAPPRRAASRPQHVIGRAPFGGQTCRLAARTPCCRLRALGVCHGRRGVLRARSQGASAARRCWSTCGRRTRRNTASSPAAGRCAR